MPNHFYLPTGDPHQHSGIRVEWIKCRQQIYISGWYDSFVGIEGGGLTLREFFDVLGITEKDCARAWREREK